MLGNISFQEIFLVLLAILILFGSAKIPEIARSLRKGIEEFKKDPEKDKKEETKDTEAKK